MLKYLIYIILLFTIAVTYSCKDPVSGQLENQPPNTYLSLFPDSTIAPGSTLKTIRWWGDDPDGYVAGFRISFDSVNWGFTTKNDSTFILHITGDDSTFRFFVAAVDDQGLIDNTPATNLYPVINSAPSVRFDAGTEIPDTTFPVATFKWTGTDPDGNENIRFYQYSLNDTLDFTRISGSINLLTLTKDSGLALNANNVLYLRAEDDAGALSPIVRMPDTSRTWYVRSVRSEILFIKDMPLAEFPTATSYFNVAFDTIRYDVLDIKSNNGNLIPKIINPMFIETLKLFNIVVWSANRGNVATDNANISLAQNSLPFYLQTGRKLFFTTGLPNAETQEQGSIFNFAPIDSVSNCTISLIGSGVNVTNVDTSYPVITTSTLLQRIRGIKTTTPTQIIYRLPVSNICTTNPVVAIKDTPVNPKIILMSIPVYQLNGNMEASKTLFRKILIEEFGHN
ncbi:MAG: hypothetical protein ABIY50_02435 [Ignavibacteria bacterium]